MPREQCHANGEMYSRVDALRHVMTLDVTDFGAGGMCA
jgi:hypothetical protein